MALVWLKAVLLTLLTWVALLFVGLGGPLGMVSQSLASQLATHAQPVQRLAGSAQVKRTARQELPVVAATSLSTRVWGLAPGGSVDSALPAHGNHWQGATPCGHDSATAASDVPCAVRDPAHPCRAPPLLA